MGAKGKVTVYRLENSWGLGPYRAQACGTHDYGYGPNHPPPHDDGLDRDFEYFKNKYHKSYNKNKVKFGFKSLEQLYDWFPQEIISKFHQSHNICIITKEVREDLVRYGYKQVIFYDIRSPSIKLDYKYEKTYLPLKFINTAYPDKWVNLDYSGILPKDPSSIKNLTEALNIINEQ